MSKSNTTKSHFTSTNKNKQQSKKEWTILTALLFGILFFSSFIANAQKDNTIAIGKIDSLYSKTLGEERKIWIHLPQSAQNNVFSKQRYPVVYLLDGDAHFSAVVGMIEHLSTSNGTSICPEMIVVGIPNTDRMRDLTISHMAVDPTDPFTAGVETSGGGDNFIAFIEKEVIPYVNANYPTTSYKMLIGHSLGGLIVMDVAMNHTNLFNAYVAIDPSMWWDKSKLLKEITKSYATKKMDGVSLYLACANTMEDGMTTTTVRKDTSKLTEHIRAILETNDLLNKDKNSKLKYLFKYYDKDDHGSVPLIAEYDALHFIFDFYNLKLSTSEFMNMNKDVITKIEKHYAKVSEKFGYTVLVPETMANSMGYALTSQKKYDEAEYIFQLNIKNYPGSANVYDSMGDCYLAKGDKEKAIANFKKALSINSNFIETKSKLEKLLKG